MINDYSGAEFDADGDNDTIITRQLDGSATLTFTVTAQVNSLVCHSSFLPPSYLSLSLSPPTPSPFPLKLNVSIHVGTPHAVFQFQSK